MQGIWKSLIAFLVLTHEVAADESDLTSLLDEVTAIATKSKLNIDYQPSVVSVLHADKLKKTGIRNLHEALALLPGIETSMLHTGWKQVIVRGIYNPDTFVFDKYKLYIDGVDVGSDLYSTSYYYLDFPIELIDRIEVLRGSASTVYGPGAFSAAINVITISSQPEENDKVFGSIGTYGYTKGGFVQHLNSGDWSLGIDGYHQHSNKTLEAGPEFKANSETAYMRSDYNSLENFEDYSIGITAKHDDWTLIARYKSEITDNFYGLNEELEPVTTGYQHNKSGIVELQNNYSLARDVDLESKIGFNYYAFTFDSTLYQNYNNSGLTIRMNPTFEQLNTNVEMNLRGKNIDDNEWMIGLNARKINTIKNVFGTTYRDQNDGGPIVMGSMEYLDGQYGLISGDNDQWVKSLYAQEIYSLNDAWDISANLRLDSYALFGDMVSYRVGSVYRFDDNNIFKGVFGRSYRAPSYVEAFQTSQKGFKTGNPNVKPESIDTYELAYTYKNKEFIFRTNVFYSILHDVIDSIQNEPEAFIGDYANHRQRNEKGLEMELTRSFNNGSELMGNFSYVTTEYFSPDYSTPIEYQSPEISEVMIKGYYLYPLNEQFGLNTAWYYNGPKRGYIRESGNTQTYGSTMVVDETLSYHLDDLSMITVSVKNLFNEAVIYPSYSAKHDGILREGRNWLVTYEKQF
ncbi:MAG: TonB-dependent receptor [Sulfuricurvum sp.]|uniref:TonB-dependent receptor plug domain-containing protein n=1 Tax=Sulfuricurvum sp. TaxID=2025608 RepID=UPI002607B611|nr:TonB-dependent receptor [Sulfuricurvum sp.]MDD2828657.1 TonB-dependent receptor [Sulfuricurvum sp.]MDD4948334.1 TonB-dependent receptor [Sulfuricurvum sp.]